MNNPPLPPTPQEKLCPQKKCFFWLEKGDQYASGLHKSLDAAIEGIQTATESRCECSFGICIRDERLPQSEKDPKVYKDFYEPMDF